MTLRVSGAGVLQYMVVGHHLHVVAGFSKTHILIVLPVIREPCIRALEQAPALHWQPAT